jgi:translocation and assembly module TamB
VSSAQVGIPVRSGRKVRIYILASVVALLVVLALGTVAVLRSNWFTGQIRERLLATVEQATGGRAEAGNLHFDWKRMRVEADQFVLHGTEPAGKPPLLRVASIAAGLKIISWTRRDVDLQYLDVNAPEINLIVYPDGRTNLPEPKAKPESRPLEALINLAIGRFQIENGVFAVESGSKTPFSATGRNLDAKFAYEPGGKKYRGDIAIQPLDLEWNGQKLPLDLQMALALERDRITIESARYASGSSHVAFSGVIDNLASPHVSVSYEAAASLADVPKIFRLDEVEAASVSATGKATYQSGEYSVTGDWHATGQASWPIHDRTSLRVRNLNAGGTLRADARVVELSGIRLEGEASYSTTRLPAEGRLAALAIRKNHVEAHGLALNVLGGTFEGDGALEGGNQFRVQGVIRGFDARRAVAVYNPREPLPWDSLLSGTLSAEGSLGAVKGLRLAADLALNPAQDSTVVSGHVSAAYDTRAGTLDLGSSTLNLPSSRLAFSGSIGRQIHARIETHDLADFLPLFGENERSLPVKLEHGSLLFDGTVDGKLDDPRIAGHINLGRFSWSGEPIDSLDATVSLSPHEVHVQDGALVQGPLRARFDATVGLANWKTSASSSLAARGAVRNADIDGLLARLGQRSIPAAGTLNATGEVSGTLGAPRATGQVEITKGAFRGEPFDRLTANVSYDTEKLQATSGQIIAGPKQARFAVELDHSAGNLEKGRVHFNLTSNGLPLDQVAILHKIRPGLKGVAQVSAKGDLTVDGGNVRIAALNADLTARGLQLPGTPLRDLHVTAQTESALAQAPVLRTSIDSGFATSTLHGQGEWRLEGDYPGSVDIHFSKLDLADLRDWLSPTAAQPAFQGFAEGDIRISGAALKPESIKGELRVQSFELAPAATPSFTLRNSGPIVVTATNSAVTIESARLTGPSTDVTIGGRVLFNQKNPLDVRANGRIDLGLLKTLNDGITSSGNATIEADVRGSLDKPQINGRLAIEDASLSHPDIPNGLSKARGVVVFTGDRATIQDLTAETGGGQIRLTGFAGFTAGRPVFGLQANANGVRIRYPEGISTVANANLNFSGSADRSTLTGTVSVLRSTFNLESNFSSLLAKSAEPVRTPSATTGFLGGLNIDVQIQTAPDVQLDTSLTQGLQADANLRLRGTAANPALLGRINIFQGQVLFFGTKYTISQGSVSFNNPAKIEPILNMDLQTKARGIDITFTVAGPLDKLTVTPRSDPPLSSNEIISVLATGSYASDTAFRLQQNASPQAVQQSTASALLGQMIASPVTGRLQRFFGLSGIRIDPTLPGVEYNAQARLTLQQQVTPDVTFTYIANVTQANPQVVSVEWAMSKQWSVVAEREENGLIGLDFFLKKRFK